MSNELEKFFYELLYIQQDAIMTTLCKEKDYGDTKDMLDDVTFETIVGILELIDGYRAAGMKYEIINKITGDSVNHDTDIHDYAEEYISNSDNEVGVIMDPVVPGYDRIPNYYRGTVIWSKDIPIAEQVLSIKKILKGSLHLSDREMLRKVKEGTDWMFGEFPDYEAEKILKSAKESGIRIEMVDIETGKVLT